jgi:hypothetical protein
MAKIVETMVFTFLQIPATLPVINLAVLHLGTSFFLCFPHGVRAI